MAYQFNGTSQYLNCAAPIAAAPITMACWARRTSMTGNASFIHLSNLAALSGGFNLIHNATAGVVRVNVQQAGGTAQIASTTTNMVLNKWHHVCGVFSSSTSRSAYIDGGNSAGPNTVSVTPNNVSTTLIGVAWFNSYLSYIPGNVADVGIWNAVLTTSEIASLAQGVSCRLIRPQSLVFYAPLIRNLVDVRGSLTLTNIGSATVADHPRIYC